MSQEPVPRRDVCSHRRDDEAGVFVMDEPNTPGDDADGIPLIEGWMLGRLFFPVAMDEIQRVPAANDRD